MRKRTARRQKRKRRGKKKYVSPSHAHSHKTPELERYPEKKKKKMRSWPEGSRVFVGNLASEHTNKRELREVFEVYGPVDEVILHDSFGFIQFQDPRSAADAIAKENGRVIGNRKIGAQTLQRPCVCVCLSVCVCAYLCECICVCRCSAYEWWACVCVVCV